MPPDTQFVIVGGRIVTGDGTTLHERGVVRIRGTRIIDVARGDADAGSDAVPLNAAGCTVIPGIVNAHAHGCIHGPSMPSGSVPVRPTDVDYFRNRHLLSGTTTLLNVCGLALPDEIDGPSNQRHAMDIHLTTAHTTSNLAAAIVIDGGGLSERHKIARIDDMVDKGAKALGEAGGGQTLGGGAQDYRFIPAAIEAATGISIHPKEARALKEAVLGRYLDRGLPDLPRLNTLLIECGLAAKIGASDLIKLIRDTVMPPVVLSLKGFDEIAAASERLDFPAIFHNAAPTAATLLKLAETYPKARMIAGHSNHPMFAPEEAVRFGLQLRKRGVAIDVSTLDCIETRWRNDTVNIDALVEAGLVDTLSTDFAGGDWDSILSAIQRMVRKSQLLLPAAIALATGNVSKTFPELAADRGLLEKGKRADVVIVENHNLGRVRHVVANGELVVFNGAMGVGDLRAYAMRAGR
ncbi:amidohydrolase (plasmid) [Rhizobium ruizarguesonis]|uniref:Amidohydrolase n=1 Tax=Rhizobium ruizarguesonis TaxID=2081791 RepID=A0AAE8Q5L1_9HYPH|nr:amidohydrolase family protein [Rhizobium ruizarguesonis]NEH32846.1 amidohydrolase family protein [Rhizobium ruizarguesonis]NEI52763.1 amidohydrolase family protein [Rhizobium ruizarguesonis]NEJ10240.1 amidohydrolase family protein [Rhizobium ruizarguesonis]NEK12675.1 amidohydrolase family protein [Rhizobium ruizarguesonis]TAT97566.1 amidohydrolase [Rhizobium ruizarguesonis]